MAKTIELWDGYAVNVNEQLLDDFDFISDLNKATKSENYAELIALYFAIVGGEQVFNDTRAHITEEKGYFSQAEVMQIVNKINDALPKAGNPAQTRSWKNSR